MLFNLIELDSESFLKCNDTLFSNSYTNNSSLSFVEECNDDCQTSGIFILIGPYFGYCFISYCQQSAV